MRLAFIDGRERSTRNSRLRVLWPRAEFVRDDARAAELVVDIDLGSANRNIAAGRLRDQFPGPGMAGAARTRTRRDGHIRRAGKESSVNRTAARAVGTRWARIRSPGSFPAIASCARAGNSADIAGASPANR